MDKPVRVQRKRVKGWKMPPNTVYAGRPTKWGNPFVVGADGSAQECVDKYIVHLFIMPIKSSMLLEQLRGKNLACWCPLDQPCHADVLLEIANTGDE